MENGKLLRIIKWTTRTKRYIKDISIILMNNDIKLRIPMFAHILKDVAYKINFKFAETFGKQEIILSDNRLIFLCVSFFLLFFKKITIVFIINTK